MTPAQEALLDTDLRKEKVRRLLVRMIFIIYWLAIFEGALRKWFLPSLDKILFFSKDPLVLAVYGIAFTHRMWPRRTAMFTYANFLIFMGCFLLLIQMVSVNLSPLILIYGWRNYFLYLPLIFIIGETFRAEDLKRLIRQTLLVALPMALLVYKQYVAPPTAWINKLVTQGTFTDSGKSGGEFSRITGTFSFFHGYQMFLGSIAACLMSVWDLPERYRVFKKPMLIAVTAAVILSFAVDFTRAPLYMAAMVLTASFASIFLVKRASVARKVWIMPVVILILALAVMGKFTVAKNIRETKLESEDAQERMYYATQNLDNIFFYTLQIAPLGTGMGSTGRGATVMAERFVGATAHEDDWKRAMYELGPFASVVFIVFRICFVVFLLREAVKAVRRTSNPLPLLFWAYVGPIFLIWHITHYGTVHAHGFLFAGLTLAACQLGKRTSPQDRNPWSD
jgi:hypothetical protein